MRTPQCLCLFISLSSTIILPCPTRLADFFQVPNRSLKLGAFNWQCYGRAYNAKSSTSEARFCGPFWCSPGFLILTVSRRLPQRLPFVHHRQSDLPVTQSLQLRESWESHLGLIGVSELLYSFMANRASLLSMVLIVFYRKIA
jgi:hypothetical protein